MGEVKTMRRGLQVESLFSLRQTHHDLLCAGGEGGSTRAQRRASPSSQATTVHCNFSPSGSFSKTSKRWRRSAAPLVLVSWSSAGVVLFAYSQGGGEGSVGHLAGSHVRLLERIGVVAAGGHFTFASGVLSLKP